jgi:hypothetical protein
MCDWLPACTLAECPVVHPSQLTTDNIYIDTDARDTQTQTQTQTHTHTYGLINRKALCRKPSNNVFMIATFFWRSICEYQSLVYLHARMCTCMYARIDTTCVCTTYTQRDMYTLYCIPYHNSSRHDAWIHTYTIWNADRLSCMVCTLRSESAQTQETYTHRLWVQDTIFGGICIMCGQLYAGEKWPRLRQRMHASWRLMPIVCLTCLLCVLALVMYRALDVPFFLIVFFSWRNWATMAPLSFSEEPNHWWCKRAIA